MLHAKFQDHRTSSSGEEDFFKVFTIYGHGGHLGHVTWTNYIKFRSPFQERRHIKFGFDLAVSVEKTFKNGGHIQVYSPGAGADNPLGSIFFH